MTDLLKLTPTMPETFGTSSSPGSLLKPKPATGASVAEDFSKILQEHIGGLIETTQNAARMQRDFAAGKTDNIHDVMIAGAKANLAMETALQVRNLALRAYTTLSQLR